MDFSIEYNQEQETFAEEVRAWLDENLPANIIKFRNSVKMPREQWEKRRELARRLGQKGWLYPQYPTKYGGGSLSADHRAVLARELEARGLNPHPHYDSGGLAAPAILVCGTDEQKERLLPPILRGEKTTWQLFTEPEAGTDEANQQTDALRATREKDHFIVNGGKIFVGCFHSPPDQFLLLTRSDPDAPRHRNLAMFLAPSDLPGIEIQPLDLFPTGTMAQGCYETSGSNAPGVKNSVFFNNVKIHESFLIGGDRDGWKVTTATLTAEHGDRSQESEALRGGSEGGVHIPRNALVEKFLDLCRNDPKVNKRLKENPILQDAMVDIFIGGQIDRLLAIRNAALLRGGTRLPYAGPQSALFMKNFGMELTAKMAKVLGPYVLTDDAEWGLADELFEVCLRNGVCIAPGGTPEALKIVISRALRIGR